MAAPSYTEDLTDINLAEVNTNWTDINFSGGGGGANTAGADFALQGTNCIDRPVSNAERGIIYNNGATIPGAVAAGVHIYQWLFVATPGVTDTLALRGAYTIAGTGTGALVQFHVEGNDTYGAAGRTGRCYPYRYNNTSNTGSSPYRTLTGSPGATPQYFGAGLKTTASVKGSNVGVDAVRYGTGAYLTAGELISAGDGSNNPCTFAGFQAQNDNISNRWGILTLVAGSYELQGIFAIGRNNAGTATLCRFSDSDKNIVIPENPHVLSTFNQFIIDHASTVCIWTNINITSLGTTSRGNITVANSSTSFTATGGVWTDIGTVVLAAAATLNGVTLRRSGQITLGGGTLTDCLITNNRDANSVVAATLTNITGNSFVSDGSNHAVQLTTIGSGTMTWSNTLSGYVAGVAGNPVTPTSTGNEAIYVNANSSSNLTINVAAGATTPSIRVGGSFTGNVIVVSSFTLTLTGVPSGNQVTIVNSSTRTERFNTTSTGANITYSHSGGETVDILVVGLNIEPNSASIYDITLANADQTIPINTSAERNYVNP